MLCPAWCKYTQPLVSLLQSQTHTDACAHTHARIQTHASLRTFSPRQPVNIPPDVRSSWTTVLPADADEMMYQHMGAESDPVLGEIIGLSSNHDKLWLEVNG
jgi:hypothetical protein